MTSTLASRLRAETREAHRHAERSPFVAELFRGEVDRRRYVRLLRSLHPVYAAMEEGLESGAGDPRLEPFRRRGLGRRAGLERDLETLHGPDWAREVDPVAPAAPYAARVREVARGEPARLLAHAYVRYLGDLSGGRMLERAVARMLGVEPGEAGTAFYDFGELEGSTGEVKDALRRGMDAAPVPADEVVEEARWAFARNREIFDALAGEAGRG